MWDDIDLATDKNGPSYSPKEQLRELNWTLNSEHAFPTSREMSYSQNMCQWSLYDQVIVCVIIERHSDINGKLMQTVMQSTS